MRAVKEPDAHAVQLVAPDDGATLPGKQGWHWMEPASGALYPGVHGVHTRVTASYAVPNAQDVHASAPYGRCWPGGHANVHVPLSARMWLEGHSTH